MPLAVGAKYTTREELRKASQAVSKAPDFRFSQMYARRRGYVHLRKCKYSEISVVHRCVQLIPSHTGTFIRCTHLCTSDTWTLEPRVQLRLSLIIIHCIIYYICSSTLTLTGTLMPHSAAHALTCLILPSFAMTG